LLLVVTNKSKYGLYAIQAKAYKQGKQGLAAEVTFLHTLTGEFHMLRAVISLRNFGGMEGGGTSPRNMQELL
jgi:hypothetical protein